MYVLTQTFVKIFDFHFINVLLLVRALVLKIINYASWTNFFL